MDGTKLLTRDQFREGVLKRDNYTCVMCDSPAVDAHHILERRLFTDGGYYLDNGASVCTEHHLASEMTTVSTDQLREACGIKKTLLPTHFYESTDYDKWGNVILPDGRRLRGELFNDESVQKILTRGGVLESFVKYVKYPRTYHLPWSPGMHSDDRMMPDVTIFDGKIVVVHEKLDGENTSMYNDYMHARSVTSGNHATRNWIKAFHSQICSDIPADWRFNVENMYGKHSIEYTQLDSYGYLFAIWNETNNILTWDQTLEWCELVGVTPCPVIYHGIYDEALIKKKYAEYQVANSHREIEGYVVRVDESFHFSEFKHKIGKYVREGHVTTTQHWMHGRAVVPNKLKPGLHGFERWVPSSQKEKEQDENPRHTDGEGSK